jgi:hypothetical protein
MVWRIIGSTTQFACVLTTALKQLQLLPTLIA